MLARRVASPDPSLAAAAREMLGPGIAVAGGRLEDWACSLWPEEEEAIARAVPGRRREFIAGRAAARVAMGALGAPPMPLPRRPDGPPRWPRGLFGGIAHGGGHVLAALGRGARSLGVDLEPFRPLPADLAAEICRPDEDASCAVRVFGAKEAAYKAQFMLTGKLIDFAALRVVLGRAGGFEAEFMIPVGRFAPGDRLAGRQSLVGPLLLSTTLIP